MSGPALVDIPLESRDRYSATKKLITAVSIESPDLFRIHGVPCIDRGPDKLRPPAAYEHWRDDGSTSVEDIARVATGAAVQPVKKTANFARPSSVSADTPNFFKVRDKKEDTCTYSIRNEFVICASYLIRMRG